MTDLHVRVPSYCFTETSYIIDIIVHQWLGQSITIEKANIDEIRITAPNSQKTLFIPTRFFKLVDMYGWLSQDTKANDKCEFWCLPEEFSENVLLDAKFPILFGDRGIFEKGNETHLCFDLFGSAFYLLTCYHDSITNIHDDHGRNIGKKSYPYMNGFLNSPVVNHFCEILWCLLLHNWPHLRRAHLKFEVKITCDVDWPFEPHFYFLYPMIKRVIREGVVRRDLKSSANTICHFAKNLTLGKTFSGFNDATKYIIDVNDRHGNTVDFYFIPVNTSRLDSFERFKSKRMKNLLRAINDSGHRVGIHPGYETYNNEKNFDRSVRHFRKKIALSDRFGGRQHFLRFDPLTTPKLWDDHNISYDSSVAYADVAGFRSGSCIPYSMYDLKNRRILSVKQYPLIAMESTVIDEKYENLGHSDEAYQRFMSLKNECRKYNGIFTLLWHNTHLQETTDRELYERVLKG